MEGNRKWLTTACWPSTRFITSQGGLTEHESVTLRIPLIRFVKFTAI
jgi:hypothetical protein